MAKQLAILRKKEYDKINILIFSSISYKLITLILKTKHSRSLNFTYKSSGVDTKKSSKLVKLETITKRTLEKK